MADIPGAQVKMNDVEVDQDAPLTEALFNKIGANINSLIDEAANHEGRITTAETKLAAQEVTFAPADDSINVTPGNNSDTALASITTLRGCPVMIAITAGELFCTTTQTAGGGSQTYGQAKILRDGTPIAIIHNGQPAGISAALAAGQSIRQISAGYVTGFSESPPISPAITPALLGRPTIHSQGGTLVIMDIPGAAGTYAYSIRLTVAGTGGTSISSFTGIAGFLKEI